MDLCQKVVAARKKKGLTQEELADLTNITVRTIQRIESGESTPRPYTLKSIAAALAISFDELKATEPGHSSSLADAAAPPALFDEESGKHFIQMLCLSCFSYLVVPFVHPLIPVRMLKNSNEQNPKVIAFARRVIRVQLYWKAAFWILMFLTLAYNIIRGAYFQKTCTLNYLWPFFIMYLLNAVIISSDLLRIRKADISFQPSL